MPMLSTGSLQQRSDLLAISDSLPLSSDIWGAAPLQSPEHATSKAHASPHYKQQAQSHSGHASAPAQHLQSTGQPTAPALPQRASSLASPMAPGSASKTMGEHQRASGEPRPPGFARPAFNHAPGRQRSLSPAPGQVPSSGSKQASLAAQAQHGAASLHPGVSPKAQPRGWSPGGSAFAKTAAHPMVRPLQPRPQQPPDARATAAPASPRQSHALMTVPLQPTACLAWTLTLDGQHTVPPQRRPRLRRHPLMAPMHFLQASLEQYKGPPLVVSPYRLSPQLYNLVRRRKHKVEALRAKFVPQESGYSVRQGHYGRVSDSSNSSCSSGDEEDGLWPGKQSRRITLLASVILTRL